MKSVETRQTVDHDTIFEAASLAKQVKATIAHALATVTARHVLSHSSGRPNWRSEAGQQLKPQAELALRANA